MQCALSLCTIYSGVDINYWVLELLFFTGGEFRGALAYYGVGTNLVSYLSKVQQQSHIDAVSNTALWQGTCYLSPLLGAFLADSYWGRHRTILISLSTFTFVSVGITQQPLHIASRFSSKSATSIRVRFSCFMSVDMMYFAATMFT